MPEGKNQPKITRRRALAGVAQLALLSACSFRHKPTPTAEPLALDTVTPPTPIVPTTTMAVPPSRPEEIWFQFVGLWNENRFEEMYSLLTTAARERISQEEFARMHGSLTDKANLHRVSVDITASLVTGSTAEVGYRKVLVSEVFGNIVEDQKITLFLQDNRWLLEWFPYHALGPLDYDTSLIVEELDTTRGVIYDREGKPLAAFGQRVVVGIVPGELEDENMVLQKLSEILNDDPDTLRSRYASAGRPDWFMPVGEISPDEAQKHYAALSELPGILLRERLVRFYPERHAAAHLTGYVGVITAEQLNEKRAAGYREDDIIGQAGLERAFEGELAGQRGARLLVLSNKGEVKAVAAEKATNPSEALYTTVDVRLQRLAFSLLEGKRGAIVALVPDTGEILAMASSPSFDPNLITAGMSAEQWNELLQDEGRPLVNRATQSELPPGSVFKVVTESAALENGVFTTDSPFYCNGLWSGLGDAWTVRCWLRSGHGSLSLSQGLTASCNVVFAETGNGLQQFDREALPEFSLQCGFGTRTGIRGVPESTGLVPTPQWKERAIGEAWFPGDTVNMAIGQGNLLVTPLQIARLIAAVANGGTLNVPRLVLSFGAPSSAEARIPEVEPSIPLPVAPEHLTSIHDSLVDGCMMPLGTAYSTLGSMNFNVAGKTGTAENPPNEPHAWFAGYAPAEKPQIAIAIVIENGGQGSIVATPIFRSLVEAYLQGNST